MSWPERGVWTRFLQTPEGSAHAWQYEVELGFGSYGPGPAPPMVPDFYLRLLRKRLDAVAEEPDRVIIAEVKEVAGMGALGQLLTYRKLYQEEKAPTAPITLWAVAARIDYDVAPVFNAFAVRTFVV